MNMALEPKERLEIAAKAIHSLHPELVEELDTTPEELARIAADLEIRADQYDRLLSTMIYFKQRVVHKKSKTEAFKIAFPERCYVSDEDVYSGQKEVTTFQTDLKPGDPLPKATLVVKAKRIEASKLYTKIYELMNQNLYVTYAIDRMKVLDAALDIALDESASIRDRDRYMKLFLEETRKDDKMKSLEAVANITVNNVSVVQIEDKLNKLAEKLDGMSAGEIIEVTHDSSKE